MFLQTHIISYIQHQFRLLCVNAPLMHNSNFIIINKVPQNLQVVMVSLENALHYFPFNSNDLVMRWKIMLYQKHRIFDQSNFAVTDCVPNSIDRNRVFISNGLYYSKFRTFIRKYNRIVFSKDRNTIKCRMRICNPNHKEINRKLFSIISFL